MTLGRPAGALWLLSLATAASAQSSASPAPAASAALAPSLEQVMARVASAPVGAEPGLFQRVAAQRPAGSAAKGADDNALVPALAWAMEQLDPASFAVLRPVPIGGSGARLRTGDVFVLQFSTNLPGQVRLENINPQGLAANLGTYTVLLDQLNRLPRDKGIQLQGQPGLERLRFYFYPCLPAEADGKPWAGDFKGRLPPCPAAGGGAGALRSLPGSYGTVTPRALVNLAQADAHVAIAGSADYQPGDLTLMEALIRHESPSHGR